jgi:phytoene/squalene synthetase
MAPPITGEVTLARTGVDGDVHRSAGGAPSSTAMPLARRQGEDDAAWCVRALAAVSRTFARPIALLDPPLDEAVRVAYQLCRVADTVEDHPTLPGRAREALLSRFVDVLEGRQAADTLAAAWRPVAGRSADDAVCLQLVVAPVFAAAWGHLDAGLAYLCALPAHATGIRLFCALPLWMAVATLRLAQGHDGMCSPGVAVKISRDEVERLIADAAERVDDNGALIEGYRALRSA